ncbi:hypothetical protein TWF696_007764 [Orbilia brochopaga]|uniref:BTB domain-containing protein n=1 Tax=Orbilia brochopaga TaxID=3140254 RepID=A0AAV9UQM0_9PEZI
MATSSLEDLSWAKATTRYSIDKNYNCEVKLKGLSNDHVYRVSDAALRLASPVLAKMVDPKSPWTKKASNSLPSQGVLTITLHDDNPEALALLFDLMHFQKQNIPKHLGLKRIFYLALVCDKYDCVDVARSLIHEFAADLKEAETNDFWMSFYTYTYRLQPERTGNNTNTGDGEDDGVGLHGNDKSAIANMLLYVSFVFSLEGIFPKAYNAYLMIWQPKERSDESDEVVSGPIYLPGKLYQHFMAEWEEKRTAIVNAVNDRIREYTYGLVYSKQGRCGRNSNCTLCDISLYGSFIRRLHYLGIFPIQEKSDALSLYELSNRVKSIQIGHYWNHDRTAVYPHNSCLGSFMSSLQHRVGLAIKKREVRLADFKAQRGVKRKLWVLEFQDGREDNEKDEGEDTEQDEHTTEDSLDGDED